MTLPHTCPTDQPRALTGRSTRARPELCSTGHRSDPHGGDQVAVSVIAGGEGRGGGEVRRHRDTAYHL